MKNTAIKDLYYLSTQIIPDNNIFDFKTQVIKNGASYYHTHAFYEFFYITFGSAKHYFNGTYTTINTGDLIVLKPNDVHCFFSIDHCDYIHRDIIISKKLWNDVCNFFHFDILELLTPSQQKISVSFEEVNLLEHLMSNFSSSSIVEKNLEKNRYVYLCLSEIIKLFTLSLDSNSQAMPAWLNELINELSLPENLFKDKHLILNKLHYSREHICRIFKQYMNITLTEYINGKRLDFAAIQLSTTDNTINEICNLCGFDSMAYFIGIFKKRFHCTPSAFRNANHKEHE